MHVAALLGERHLSGHAGTLTPILVSEPWTQRIWWEQNVLTHKQGASKATKVAKAALGACINCHQSDLNSIRVRVAGETISSTNSEHREKQPGRLGRGRDHFFPYRNFVCFSSTKPRACLGLSVARSFSKQASLILRRKPVPATFGSEWLSAGSAFSRAAP